MVIIAVVIVSRSCTNDHCRSDISVSVRNSTRDDCDNNIGFVGFCTEYGRHQVLDHQLKLNPGVKI